MHWRYRCRLAIKMWIFSRPHCCFSRRNEAFYQPFHDAVTCIPITISIRERNIGSRDQNQVTKLLGCTQITWNRLQSETRIPWLQMLFIRMQIIRWLSCARSSIIWRVYTLNIQRKRGWDGWIYIKLDIVMHLTSHPRGHTQDTMYIPICNLDSRSLHHSIHVNTHNHKYPVTDLLFTKM